MHTQARTIRVVGDSHAQACFGTFPYCVVVWVGPVTMYRAQRDGICCLLPEDNADYAATVLVFGEIDVRCHALMPNKMCIADVSLRYIQAAEALKHAISTPVYVCTIMPPTDAYRNPEFPFVGTLAERIACTRAANEVLCQAPQYGLGVIDLFGLFAGSDGTLPADISDGTVHVRPHIAYQRLKTMIDSLYLSVTTRNSARESRH